MKTKKENAGEITGKVTSTGLRNNWIFGVVAGMVALSYGADYAAEHLLGDPRIYAEEKPYFHIENFLAEDEIEHLKQFALDNVRFLTGKEAFSDGVGNIGEAIPADKDGKCPTDPELYLADGQCIVPGKFVLEYFFAYAVRNFCLSKIVFFVRNILQKFEFLSKIKFFV